MQNWSAFILLLSNVYVQLIFYTDVVKEVVFQLIEILLLLLIAIVNIVFTIEE